MNRFSEEREGLRHVERPEMEDDEKVLSLASLIDQFNKRFGSTIDPLIPLERHSIENMSAFADMNGAKELALALRLKCFGRENV